MTDLTITVGRCAQTNDVKVDDASVSRNHLKMVVHSLNNITLLDCQSSFGSFYWDGSQWQPFTQITLNANDYIFIGGAKLRLMEIMIAYQIKNRSRSL